MTSCIRGNQAQGYQVDPFSAFVELVCHSFRQAAIGRQQEHKQGQIAFLMCLNWTMCDVVQTRGSSTRVSGGSNFCFCRSSVLLFLTTMMGRQRKHEQRQNAFLMCHTWRQSVLSVQDLSNLFCLASAYGPKLLSDKIVLNFVATSPVKY